MSTPARYDLAGTLRIARGDEYREHAADLDLVPVGGAGEDGANAVVLSLAGGAKQPVKYIAGEPVGPIHDSIYRIPIEQIRPDEPRFLLRSSYQPDDDPELTGLMSSIRKTGGLLEPLAVIWKGEWQTTPDRGRRPLYRLRLGQRRWYALRALSHSGEEFANTAPVVFLPDQAAEAQQLLAALTQQKNSKPLTLLEYADTVHRLVDGHGYTTQAVADFLGEQQDRISRLNLAAQLSDRIRAYMQQDTLTLKHIDKLRACPDAALRDQIAAFVVQEGHSAEKTLRLVALLSPLPGQEPTHALLEQPDHRLRLEPLAGGSKREIEDLLQGDHYWDRQQPFLASRARILREVSNHPLHLRGGLKQPVVPVKQLMVTQTLQSLQSDPDAELDAATLALALQADLEALTQAYSQLQREAAARKSGGKRLALVAAEASLSPQQ